MTRQSLTKEQAATSYLSGLSLTQVGNKFGCSRDTVANRLRDAGVKLRTLSESLKGRSITWAAKIGSAGCGRKLSAEARAKISASSVGRTPWNKGKRKVTHPNDILYGKSGSDHWNWKGGISSENIRIRNSSEYKAWRDAVFARDNWTCQKCGQRGGILEADHIKLFSQYIELRFVVDNGRTLCKTPCHSEETRKSIYGK
jgi:hypothetical protein